MCVIHLLVVLSAVQVCSVYLVYVFYKLSYTAAPARNPILFFRPVYRQVYMVSLQQYYSTIPHCRKRKRVKTTDAACRCPKPLFTLVHTTNKSNPPNENFDCRWSLVLGRTGFPTSTGTPQAPAKYQYK